MEDPNSNGSVPMSAHHMHQLQNKYWQCNEHQGKYCFVQTCGTHRFLTIQELTLWAASIVSLQPTCMVHCLEISIKELHAATLSMPPDALKLTSEENTNPQDAASCQLPNCQVQQDLQWLP